MSLQGVSDDQICEYTGISGRSLSRFCSEHHRVRDKVRQPLGRPRKLSAIEVKFLRDCIERQPDTALLELQAQLREVCHIETSLQTIASSLHRMGYTMKMLTRSALERNEQDREEFKAIMARDYYPEQLIFADESHFNRLTLRRPFGWAMRGERARCLKYSHRGAKYSILPALCLDGILHLEVVENAVTGNDFCRFVEGLLPHMNAWPLPFSVLVVDNATIHKVEAYSPDFNPIELAFSTIKAWLRANRHRVNMELDSGHGCIYNVFWEGVHSVTAEHAKGWYSHYGYQPRP